MSKVINIGIAGTGWIVEKVYIPILTNLSGVKIVSFFEPVEGRRTEMKSKYQFRQYSFFENYDDFLQSNIDCVIVATPNYTHEELSVKALEKGLDVLCEKPAALSEKEINRVIEAAKKGHAVYMPGFVNRFRQDVRTVKELIDSNRIGEIKEIKAGWLRKGGIPRLGSWFTKKELSGGGVLFDLGSHVLDICLMLLGTSFKEREVTLKSVYKNESLRNSAAWFENRESTNNIVMDVESTVFATIKAQQQNLKVALSWNAPVKGDCTYFYINGTKGKIVFRTLFGYSTNKLWEDSSIRLIIDDQPEEVIVNEHTAKNADDAFYEMLSCFVDKVKGKVRKEVCAEDAVRNVCIIEELYKNERIIDG